MKLNKRECNIRIRLTPCSADFEKVQFTFGKSQKFCFLNGAMGSRFSSFLTATYCLYEEDDLPHLAFCHPGHEILRYAPTTGTSGTYLTRADLHWEGEPYHHTPITLWRENHSSFKPMPNGDPDPVKIIFWRIGRREYTMDGRDLCYAVARAYTEAFKKYGFTGFFKSSSGQYPGDTMDIEKLLFIKAYALGVLETRETKRAWEHPPGWMKADASSFEKEIELLLFDM